MSYELLLLVSFFAVLVAVLEFGCEFIDPDFVELIHRLRSSLFLLLRLLPTT
jgi:hypothetical protein